MPDDPQNNGNEGNDTGNTQQYGTPSDRFAQKGQGTPSIDPSLQKSLDALGDDSSVLLTNIQKLVQALSAAKTPADALSKDFEKWKDQLKYAIDATDDVGDALKSVLAINRKFAAQGIAGMNKRSYGEVKKYLEELDDSQKRLTGRKNFLSADGQQKLKQAITHTGDALTILKRRIRDAGSEMEEIDASTLHAVARAAKRATAETTKLGFGFKTTAGHVKDLGKIMGLEMTSKFSKAAHMAQQLKEWRGKARQVGHKGGGPGFEQLKKDFATRYGLTGKAGQGDLGAIAAWRKTRAGAGAPAISGRTGMSGWLDRVAEKAASGAEKGGVRGFIGRHALESLEVGGGEAGMGLGLRGAVAGAGGMEGILGIASEAALPLAALEIVKKIVDSTIASNSEMYKLTGKGGVMAGGPGLSAQDILSNVLRNVTGPMQDMAFVNKEDNIKMIQAIEDLGVAIPELAQAQPMDANDTLAGGARGIGGVQRFAYGLTSPTKALGLSPEEAAREDLKYLYQFKQSQAAVNNLFKQFVKDTQAAGLTTTKYLQLIDNITTQFDRMGKSLGTVTDIMRVLGSTGNATAEDLQEAMGMLLGNQNRTLEQSSLVYTMMSGARRQALATGLQANVQTQRESVRAGLRDMDIGLDNTALSSIDDVRLAIHKLNETTDKNGKRIVDGVQGKAVYGSLQQLLREMQMAEYGKQFAAGKMSAVDFAAAEKNFGTATTKMTTNVQSIMATLKVAHVSLNDVIRGRVHDAALLNKLQEAFGNSPDWQKQLANTLSLIGDATQKVAAEAPQQLRPGEVQDIFGDAVRVGLAEEKKGMTLEEKRAKINELALNKATAPRLATALEGDPDLLFRLISGNSGVAKAYREKAGPEVPDAKDIAKITTDLGKRLEQVMSFWFGKLVEVVTMIYDALEKYFGDTDKSWKDYLDKHPAAKQFEDNKTKMWDAINQGRFKDAGHYLMENMKADLGDTDVPNVEMDKSKTQAAGAGASGPTTVINQTNNNVTATQTPPVQAPPANRSGESGSVFHHR